MLQYSKVYDSTERQQNMKKRILTGITVVAVLLFLIIFAIWQNQSDTEDTPPPVPEDSCDALILVDPSKPNPSNQYDLKHLKKNSDSSDRYLPVGIDNNSLYYEKTLAVHINRSLPLTEKDFCHYGLFEKNNKPFAIFHSEVSTKKNAERLCHLLLCYRDYFPILLFGKFDDTTVTLLTDVCQLSSASINGITYFYQNLSVKTHETSGSLLLHFQKTPRTLDLSKKMVALTFDDGPSSHTAQILQSLTKYHAKATFFVNGDHVIEYPTVIEDIFANQSEIGNHTNLHELFEHNTQGIIRKSIEETNKKVRKIIGIGTFVVRPPGGGTLDRYQNPVTLGYPLIRWSLDTLDYTEHQSASSLLERIQAQVRHGEIILMHDTKPITAEASDSIISYLTSQDFQLVTVSELLEFSSDGAVADRVYNNTFSKK